MSACQYVSIVLWEYHVEMMFFFSPNEHALICQLLKIDNPKVGSDEPPRTPPPPPPPPFMAV